MIEEVFAFPLSYAQQRLWFLDQLEPGNPAYNIFATEVFNEAVQISSLEESLSEIVRRHEILRTTFVTVGGQPMQVVAPSLSLPLPVLDLSQMSEDEQAVEVERVSTEESERPFDLARGPLLRTTLLRLSERESLLLLTMHHIVSDGWSMGVFTNELWRLYEAFSAGETSPLEELPIQYADFAVWQRQWLTGEVLEQQLEYWREQLAGAPAVLELPTDKVRP
ncbi:MAG TPA: condensation domain-containing protein, partial [Pyrinomonadaceae bacterium]